MIVGDSCHTTVQAWLAVVSCVDRVQDALTLAKVLKLREQDVGGRIQRLFQDSGVNQLTGEFNWRSASVATWCAWQCLQPGEQ